nr:nuclear transport factor 2 family protein [uncultured Actinoplanes sp.]
MGAVVQEIRDVIESRAAALQAGDVKAMLAHYAPEVVWFSLAPPLVQRLDSRDTAPLTAWLGGFEAPPRREVTGLEITADGDVAFATSLDSMTAVPKGSTEEFTLWYRSTVGLRRVDGRWQVVHEHQSVPFAMDGSFRASIDLEP